MARQTTTTVTCDVCDKSAPGALVVKVYDTDPRDGGVMGYFDICGTCYRLSLVHLHETCGKARQSR
jgi:hypothetical protein